MFSCPSNNDNKLGATTHMDFQYIYSPVNITKFPTLQRPTESCWTGHVVYDITKNPYTISGIPLEGKIQLSVPNETLYLAICQTMTWMGYKVPEIAAATNIDCNKSITDIVKQINELPEKSIYKMGNSFFIKNELKLPIPICNTTLDKSKLNQLYALMQVYTPKVLNHYLLIFLYENMSNINFDKSLLDNGQWLIEKYQALTLNCDMNIKTSDLNSLKIYMMKNKDYIPFKKFCEKMVQAADNEIRSLKNYDIIRNLDTEFGIAPDRDDLIQDLWLTFQNDLRIMENDKSAEWPSSLARRVLNARLQEIKKENNDEIENYRQQKIKEARTKYKLGPKQFIPRHIYSDISRQVTKYKDERVKAAFEKKEKDAKYNLIANYVVYNEYYELLLDAVLGIGVIWYNEFSPIYKIDKYTQNDSRYAGTDYFNSIPTETMEQQVEKEGSAINEIDEDALIKRMKIISKVNAIQKEPLYYRQSVKDKGIDELLYKRGSIDTSYLAYVIKRDIGLEIINNFAQLKRIIYLQKTNFRIHGPYYCLLLAP